MVAVKMLLANILRFSIVRGDVRSLALVLTTGAQSLTTSPNHEKPRFCDWSVLSLSMIDSWLWSAHNFPTSCIFALQDVDNKTITNIKSLKIIFAKITIIDMMCKGKDYNIVTIYALQLRKTRILKNYSKKTA